MAYRPRDISDISDVLFTQDNSAPTLFVNGLGG